MEFEVDIHATTEGDIIVNDLSKDYGQYLDEEVVEKVYDKYKYSECNTLNAILRIKPNTISVIDVLLDNHSSDIDSSSFKVIEDGYYVVDHIIIPTVEWLEK
jgi:signal peptidase I